MGEITNISWCDMTFNPWVGCTKVSPACGGCYAEAMMDKRFGRVRWGAAGVGVGTRERTSAANWKKPLAWDRKAAAEGTRPFVFSASLADVFDNQVSEAWRTDLFELLRRTPNLVWLLLTKRPQNITKMSNAAGGLPANAAIGATVEDQTRADINVPALLQASMDLWRAKTKPMFLFLSCEPLLGPIDLTSFQEYPESEYFTDALKGQIWMKAGTNKIRSTSHIIGDRDYVDLCHGIDWVITGGETDQVEHKARPTHPAWFRSLRDQCAAAGTAFHHKQNGEWASYRPKAGGDLGGDMRKGLVDVVHLNHHTDEELCQRSFFPDDIYMRKFGARNTGRLLDGVEHDARPKVAA